MPDKPPEAISAQIWTPGTGQDPAKYLVDPGHWDDGTKRMTPGDLAHARPWLDSGNKIFIWPTPTEGFGRTGANQLGLHHYIGDQYVDAQIIHRDEARIEMNGVFPGISAQDNMVDFINTLNDDPPEAGMTLFVPGVFEQVKYVIPENWDFRHDPDDQTHSISYTVTFISIGEGRRLPDPAGEAPANPGNFPGTSVNLGPLDPWQIAIGIGASQQPGSEFFYSPSWTSGDGGGSGGGGGGTGGGSSAAGGTLGGYVEFPFHVSGYSDAQVAAAAEAYAESHGFLQDPENGNRIGIIHREGEIEYHGDVAGVYIKYHAPDGNTTEWTPLPPKGDGGNNDTTAVTTPTSQDTAITSTEGNQTLMDMAEAVTGAGLDWEDLYNKNQALFDAMSVDRYEAPTIVIPVGVPIMF